MQKGSDGSAGLLTEDIAKCRPRCRVRLDHLDRSTTAGSGHCRDLRGFRAPSHRKDPAGTLCQGGGPEAAKHQHLGFACRGWPMTQLSTYTYTYIYIYTHTHLYMFIYICNAHSIYLSIDLSILPYRTTPSIPLPLSSRPRARRASNADARRPGYSQRCS